MQSPTILIVEDDPVTAEYLETRLTSYGARSVLRFTNGKEAIACIQTHNVDIVLMDVEIEGELDGIETAAEIKKIKNIPLIFLSAHTQDQLLERVVFLDPLAYLIKPIREESLRVSINLALHKIKHGLEIQMKDQWLSAILNTLTEGVVGIDLEGNIIFINPVGEDLLSQSANEAKGKKLKDIISFFDEENRPFSENPIEKALHCGAAQLANNIIIKTKKKSQKIANYSMSILYDEEKKKIGAVLSLRLRPQRGPY